MLVNTQGQVKLCDFGVSTQVLCVCVLVDAFSLSIRAYVSMCGRAYYHFRCERLVHDKDVLFWRVKIVNLPISIH